jgi:hypothetical protein
MIQKFGTYEEASFFVEEKRQEGYHAEILNEGTGFLWGPRTVGGFRVQVSDEPGEFPDAREVDDDSWVTRILRVAFVVILISGAVVFVFNMLLSPLATIRIIAGLIIVFSIALIGGYVVSQNRPKPPPN